MIKLFVSSGQAFVWNADDIITLRSEHRIVGSLIGCFPRQKFQNTHKYLPLKLSAEEATLLSEKGIAQLVVNTEASNEPTNAMRDEYSKIRKAMCEKQIEKIKENRLNFLLEKIDDICKGQKRKLGGKTENSAKKRKTSENSDSSKEPTGGNSRQSSGNQETKSADSAYNLDSSTHDKNSQSELNEVMETLPCTEPDERAALSPSSMDTLQENRTSSTEIDEDTKKQIVDREMAKLSHLSFNNCCIQLFTGFPWEGNKQYVPANWYFPRTGEEELKYNVFKDLWEKGYYLTTGSKFGGDFLVYAGDPMKFHALYIVFCIENDQEIRGDDLVVYGRLGNQVKKTVIFASSNISKQVEYISLSWASDVFKKVVVPELPA